MALDAELLKTLTEHMAPEDAKVFENLTTKYKPLEEGFLRQSDYDKYMNKTKEEVAAAKQKAAEWETWSKENVPIHEDLLKSYRELEDQQKELQTQLAAAQAARAAGGEDTVNAAELEARVKESIGKLGYASKEEIQQIINTESKKLAQEEAKTYVEAAQKKFYEETLPASINFNMDAAEIAMQHMREFDGQAIDRVKFSEFMKERNLLDPKKAYDEFVRPQRDDIALKKQVAEAVKAKEEEIRQQYSGQGLPGGGIIPPGLQPKGAMQMRIEADAAAASGNHAPSVAAAAAAAELRAEGKVV